MTGENPRNEKNIFFSQNQLCFIPLASSRCTDSSGIKHSWFGEKKKFRPFSPILGFHKWFVVTKKSKKASRAYKKRLDELNTMVPLVSLSDNHVMRYWQKTVFENRHSLHVTGETTRNEQKQFFSPNQLCFIPLAWSGCTDSSGIKHSWFGEKKNFRPFLVYSPVKVVTQ